MPSGIYKHKKGFKLSEEHKKKIADSHKGICPSKKSRIKMSKSRKGRFAGDKCPAWKGGIKISHGYILVRSPNHPHRDIDGYCRQHRLVMEKHIGRMLAKKEVVHHLNGNQSDNRIDNLLLYANNSIHTSKHMKIFHKLRRTSKTSNPQ